MRLRDICTIQTGHTARRGLHPVGAGEGVPVIRLRDVWAGAATEPDRLERVRADGIAARYLVASGDVLFRSRGDQNTATALDERFREPAIALHPLFILRPKPRTVLPEFLAWAINHPAAQRQFDRVARGTNMRMVLRPGLERLQVPVPSIQTQQRIVAVDALAFRERTLSIRAADRRRLLTARLLGEVADA